MSLLVSFDFDERQLQLIEFHKIFERAPSPALPLYRLFTDNIGVFQDGDHAKQRRAIDIQLLDEKRRRDLFLLMLEAQYPIKKAVMLKFHGARMRVAKPRANHGVKDVDDRR